MGYQFVGCQIIRVLLYGCQVLLSIARSLVVCCQSIFCHMSHTSDLKSCQVAICQRIVGTRLVVNCPVVRLLSIVPGCYCHVVTRLIISCYIAACPADSCYVVSSLVVWLSG